MMEMETAGVPLRFPFPSNFRLFDPPGGIGEMENIWKWESKGYPLDSHFHLFDPPTCRVFEKPHLDGNPNKWDGPKVRRLSFNP